MGFAAEDFPCRKVLSARPAAQPKREEDGGKRIPFYRYFDS